MIAFAKPPGTSVSRTADELLAEFRATGAQPAFEELVRRYAAMVFSECYAVTKSRHDAEDAAQATFLTLAVQARTGEEIRYLGPWLQRVAHRVSLDHAKAKRRRKKREDNHHRINGTTGVATPHREGLDQLELRHQINEELQALPAKYRMPLILHYFGGLSREQMAAELKCKPATLGVRLFRARDMLGKRLAKKGIALPAVMLPMGIAMVVRESIEQHGIMAMAASASQIAEAATRVACGMRPSTGSVSVAAMALAESATNDLVLRKVRAIIAAAAIGASALAAGGATVVHKIADGSLPSLFDVGGYFRTLTGPDIKLRVDASQRLDAGEPVPQNWPTALALLGREGRLELTTVTNRPFGEPSRPLVYTNVPGNTPASANTGNGALGAALVSGGTGVTNLVRNRENPSAPAPLATAEPSAQSIAVPPARSNRGGADEAKSSEQPLPSAVLPLDEPPVYAKGIWGSGGGGGGGGSLRGNGTFSLRPVPPVSSRAATAHSTASTTVPSLAGSTSSAMGSPQTVAPQLYADGDVLRGWGKPELTGDLDNSGVVIADGYGENRTLDLSSVARTYNQVPNPPTGVNGWYARDGGKLTLPALEVSSGTSTVTWGDDAKAAAPDLVNAIRLTVEDAKSPALVSVSLLSTDRQEIPGLPKGYAALTVWSLSGLEDAHASSIEVTARYSVPGSDLAAELGGLGLFYVVDGEWKSATASVDPSRRLISSEEIPVSSLLALLTADTGSDLVGWKTDLFQGLESLALTQDPELEKLIAPEPQYDTFNTSPIYAYSGPNVPRPNRLGGGVGISGGSTVVPEPAGVTAILGISGVMLLGRRRRR